MTDFDWASAAAATGATPDGAFNAGVIDLPQSRALLWCRTDGTIETISGAALKEHSIELAAALDGLGVRRGDRVAGLIGRRPDAFALPLAVWRLGAIYVPLFSGFGSDAIAARLSDSETRVLVTDAANVPAAREARGKVQELTVAAVEPTAAGADCFLAELVEQAPGRPQPVETTLGDPATIMYTSGTTGAPKGCVIPHRGIISFAPYVRHCLALSAEDVLFSTADTGWSFGLYTTGFGPLALGATRVLYEGGFDATSWWTAMRATGATHLASAPTGFRQLAAAGDEPLSEGVPTLTAATSAGEPLTSEVVDWFRDRLAFTVHDSYGLTEMGMIVGQLRGQQAAPPRPGTMGGAIPGFEVQLLGDDGRPVPQAEAGRIAVRDNGWLLGVDYWGRSPEWQQRLRNGWWVTQDLARQDGDGSLVYVARDDDVIVTAGYNVGPFDVESALLQHPDVADAACIAEPDPRKGQIIAAYVVPCSGGDTDPEALLAKLRPWVGERVGWHAAPRRIHVLDTLPRTESGKIRRRELRTWREAHKAER